MLTSKQKIVLDFVEDFISTNGYFPTLKEVSKGTNIKSISSIHQHVKELVRKEYLEQDEEYGAFELKSDSRNRNKVPILGTIAAGQPILAVEEDNPKTITVDGVPERGEFYALTVAGDSMIEDGIYDGDIVILKKQDYANDGETVVAIIDDNSATLKKLYKTKKGFRLQPANQNMLPIYRNEVEVRGVVWEIRHRFNNISQSSKKTRYYNSLDLFAGIGGIRLGFETAGFRTVFANDFEPACKKTYDLNFNTSKLVIEDIQKIHADDLPKFDFLLGGFPCQAFSVAGYRQGFNDVKGRGNLFFDIARIIESHKPEGFLLENVKNLQNHDGGNTFKVIKDTLRGLGYEIKSKVLNSMEYGNVPQNRERIYIVGFKDHNKTKNFEFPSKIPLTKKISDILEKEVHEKYYYDGKPLYKKLQNDVNELNQVYQWRRQYVRKNKRGVCPTLTANMGMGGHNVPIIYDGKGIRKLTPRECARIQGFDDTYEFPTDLPDSKLYKQIGNSVSVPVITRVAKQMQLVI